MPVAWEVAMVQLVVTVTVRDLTHEDLPACAWSGTATHVASVARELDRAQRGEVDYLAVCPPSNLPVAIGEVDYQACPGAGMLSQLAVQAAWQSCGLGTILERAELGVEVNNPRARSLYERLGYVAYSRRPEAWDEELPDGSLTRYETVCTLMRKRLRSGPGVPRGRAALLDPAQMPAAPEEARATRWVASSTPRGGSERSSMASSSSRVISRAISWSGQRTLDSGGSVEAAAGESSKPTTATSSGTRRPASRSARMAPSAIRSEAAKTASRSGRRSSSTCMAAWPLSWVKSPASSSARSSRPASVIAWR